MERDRNPESHSRRELSGEVVCSDVADTRAVRRFVQKWVGRWIALRKPDAPSSATYFHVTFSREGLGHTVACETHLRVGTEHWSAASYGETLSEALRQCLGHMVPARLSPQLHLFSPTTVSP